MRDMLLCYPVSICTAEHLKVQRGRFVISNTDTSQVPGEHWVTFYFPKGSPYEFFDSLGQMTEDYAVGFEKILNKKYLKTRGNYNNLFQTCADSTASTTSWIDTLANPWQTS